MIFRNNLYSGDFILEIHSLQTSILNLYKHARLPYRSRYTCLLCCNWCTSDNNFKIMRRKEVDIEIASISCRKTGIKDQI